MRPDSDVDLLVKFLPETVESFVGDGLVRSAVVHQLTLMGEAANQVTPALTDRYPRTESL
jgi:uncharacterized protein with HEPN domain